MLPGVEPAREGVARDADVVVDVENSRGADVADGEAVLDARRREGVVPHESGSVRREVLRGVRVRLAGGVGLLRPHHADLRDRRGVAASVVLERELQEVAAPERVEDDREPRVVRAGGVRRDVEASRALGGVAHARRARSAAEGDRVAPAPERGEDPQRGGQGGEEEERDGDRRRAATLLPQALRARHDPLGARGVEARRLIPELSLEVVEIGRRRRRARSGSVLNRAANRA